MYNGASEESKEVLDLREILHAFAIDDWQNLGPLFTSHGKLPAILVECQGRRYVLRERPEGLITDQQAALEHRYAFGRYLREAGIPIPSLWLAPGGAPAVTIGEDSFELVQWIDGESYTSANRHSLSRVAAAASLLARLHRASLNYPGPRYQWPSEAQAGGLVQGWLNLARQRAEQSEVYAISAALSNLVDSWEAALPAAMMAIGSVRSLPEFHIHGDYHALNLRFHGNQVSAILGLDASRWEKRILDLASALFYFAALDWRADSMLTPPLVKRGFEPQRARQFLASYGAVYPPAPGEAQVLVDALTLMAPILSINGPLEDLFFAQHYEEETLVEEVLERLAWAASLPAWLNRVRGSFAEMWQEG